MAQGAPGAAEVHALTLQVLRLSKPSFHAALPVLCENTEIPGNTLVEQARSAAKCAPGSERHVLGDTLVLPAGFGNIYLGETFSCYLSFHAVLPGVIQDVSIKIELQTATLTYPLIDNTKTPIAAWNAGESHDFVIQHEVKELGKHLLHCKVSYLKDGERKLFQRKYKFDVLNPLQVKIKLPSVLESVFLEAQITNAMHCPLVLDAVRFEPAPQFTCTDLNPPAPAGEPILLRPNDVRQYLYRLLPKPGDATAAKATGVGKMDIVWKTAMGEKGRLQTSQLTRKLPVKDSVEMAITQIPPRIAVGRPFEVTCRISNWSGTALVLRLYASRAKMQHIVVNGVSGQPLGEFQPGFSRTITLSLFPLAPGMHRITGLQLVDVQSNKVFDVDNLIEVHVAAPTADFGRFVDDADSPNASPDAQTATHETHEGDAGAGVGRAPPEGPAVLAVPTALPEGEEPQITTVVVDETSIVDAPVPTEHVDAVMAIGGAGAVGAEGGLGVGAPESGADGTAAAPPDAALTL